MKLSEYISFISTIYFIGMFVNIFYPINIKIPYETIPFLSLLYKGYFGFVISFIQGLNQFAFSKFLEELTIESLISGLIVSGINFVKTLIATSLGFCLANIKRYRVEMILLGIAFSTILVLKI